MAGSSSAVAVAAAAVRGLLARAPAVTPGVPQGAVGVARAGARRARHACCREGDLRIVIGKANTCL